jgi:hypothetical protein
MDSAFLLGRYFDQITTFWKLFTTKKIFNIWYQASRGLCLDSYKDVCMLTYEEVLFVFKESTHVIAPWRWLFLDLDFKIMHFGQQFGALSYQSQG